MTDNNGFDRRKLLRGAAAGGLAAVLAGLGCRSPPGDDPDPTPGKPPVYDDPEPFVPNYNTLADLASFYTQPTDGSIMGIHTAFDTYGIRIDMDPNSKAMDVGSFIERYRSDNAVDVEFQQRVNNVYGTMLQILGMGQVEAHEEVANMIASLTDGKNTDLKNVVEGGADYGAVFFGYVDPAKTKGYIAFNIKDENGNERLLVAVDNDMVVDNTANITNITELVQHVEQNYS